METRGSRAERGRTDTARTFGRALPDREREDRVRRSAPAVEPVRVPGKDRDAVRRPRRDEPVRWRENLPNCLPLLFIGIASFAISVVLFQSAGSFHPTRLPLWMLAFSIGLVATIGGGTALLLGDFREEEAPGFVEDAVRSGKFVLVPREEYWRVKVLLRRRERETSWREDDETTEAPLPQGGDDDPAPPGPLPPLEDVERWLAELERTVRPSRPATSPPPPRRAVLRAVGPPSSARPPPPAHRRPGSGPPRSADAAVRSEYERLLAELNRAGAIPAPPAPAPVEAGLHPRCAVCGVEPALGPNASTCAVCLSPVCASCAEKQAQPDGRITCPACQHLIDASGG